MPEALDAVESAWERSIPLPAIDPEFLDEHLNPWPELRTRTWEVLSGGLRSLNLRSGELVLRVSLGVEETLEKEAALGRQLAERLHVAPVIDVGPRALLLGYVAHESLPGTSLAGQRVGRAAAALQAITFPEAGMLDGALQVREPFPSALAGLHEWSESLLTGRSGERLGPPRTEHVRLLWKQHAQELAAASATPVLVHSDFKPTNLKWLPEHQDVLVLDWEFAWAGPRLYDVGMLLRWSPPETFVAGFEAGFRAAGGWLPENWRRLAELFDLFNLLGFLDADPRPSRDADVLRRIDQTLAESNSA